MTVTVPIACERLAADATSVATLMDDVAAAASTMDTQRLAELVRRMGAVHDRLLQEATGCRAAGGASGTDGPWPSSP